MEKLGHLGGTQMRATLLHPQEPARIKATMSGSAEKIRDVKTSLISMFIDVLNRKLI